MARILRDSFYENGTEIGIFVVFFFNFDLWGFFSVGTSTQAVFAGSANRPGHEFPEDEGYLLVSFFYYVRDRDQPTSPVIIIIGIFTKWNKDAEGNQDHW